MNKAEVITVIEDRRVNDIIDRLRRMETGEGEGER